MWRAARNHLAAVALLALVGTASVAGLKEAAPGILGTRFTGYSALTLLCVALSIGPLARLWPAGLSRLLPMRRAMGAWSAAAAVLHFVYVLQFMGHPFFGHRNLVTLFLQEVQVAQPVGDSYQFSTAYRVVFDETLTVVAWTGAVALLLLTLLALISNDLAQQLLGHSAWKLLQQQAYTAMLFVSMHVLLMRFGGKTKLSPALLPWAEELLLTVLLLQGAGFWVTVRRGRVRRAQNQMGSAD